MNMFPTFLNSIPKNRSQMVNELGIPEITLAPYIWTDPEESLISRSDSALTDSVSEREGNTLSTDSSLPLSRAMTDSEIDYGRHRRLKKSFSDPWYEMRAALDAFPTDYLASLNSFQILSSEGTDDSSIRDRLRCYDEELKLKMERFFEDECRVFSPDDPVLEAFEEALQDIDLMISESNLENITL